MLGKVCSTLVVTTLDREPLVYLFSAKRPPWWHLGWLAALLLMQSLLT